MTSQKVGIRKRFTSGMLWTTLASVIGQGGNYACAIITARILGKEHYGQFAVIQSTVGATVNFAGLGLGVISTKYASQLKLSDPERLGRVLGLCAFTTGAAGMLFGVGLFALSPVVAVHVFHAPHLTNELRISSLYLLFLTMNVHQWGTLVGLESFRVMARINLLQSASSVIATVFLTHAFGLPGAVLALVSTAILTWAFYQIALRKECSRHGIRVHYSGWWAEREVLTGSALPATLSGTIGATAAWGGSALLVRQPNGFAQIAMYNAAYTMRTLVIYMPQLMMRVATPILCSLRAEKDGLRYKKTLWMNMKINTGFAALVSLALVVGAPFLFRLFGKGFTGGELIAALLLLSGTIEVAACCLAQVWFSHGKFWWGFLTNVVWALALLISMPLLIPRFGAIGLAGAYVIAWIAIMICLVAVVHRLMEPEDAQHAPVAEVAK